MPIFPRYPEAEWVPWKYTDNGGRVNFYANVMSPKAPPAGCVLHIMEGHMSTARQWASSGHYGASWHFSIGKDGHVMQHLDLEHGGYHAGVSDRQATWLPPTWPLWRGLGLNVNYYTTSIEHEGFYADAGVLTPAQAEASIKVCRWQAELFGWDWTQAHFPAHAEIDLLNRVNDFDTPDMRAVHYARMFGTAQEVEDMTEAETRALVSTMLAEAITPVTERLDRINDVLVRRMKLEKLANDEDASKVDNAIADLRKAGWTL